MSEHISFEATCGLLERALAGEARQALVTELGEAKDFAHALARLRDNMRAHLWKAGSQQIRLDRVIRQYDGATREEGFHVLHDWDGVAGKVNDDIIPVDVLHYVAEQRGLEPADSKALAVLIDYYFMHVLALLSLRIWDDGDPDGNLDRLNDLLAQLQGPWGSGQKFSSNAETLLLIATSHYEVQEIGYDNLLARVRTLNQQHQTNIALGHAASMGCHLRFGFEATYGRDTVNMRDDNVADYPWLCFAVSTVMKEYARRSTSAFSDGDRTVVIEALFNGLSADVAAFFAKPPSSLSQCEIERGEFSSLFQQHRAELLPQFEPLRPAEQAYSPLSFFFNFSHNVVKGAVVDALLWGEPWRVTLNDLLSSVSQGDATSEAKEKLARRLMGYARLNPHKIRGRLMPVIVYDPSAGRQAFSAAMRRLRDNS